MDNRGSGSRSARDGLPVLADDLGLHYPGIRDPYTTGAFGVEQAAARLRRFEFVHRKLVFLEAAHVVLRTLWEVKAALGRHLYEDAESANAFRERILDLRQNPSVLSRDPDQRLTLLLDELLGAQSDEELLVGLYGVVKPALLEAQRDYVRTTQQIVDQPTVRLLRTTVADLEDQVAWGERAIEVLVDDRGRRSQVEPFAQHLRSLLLEAGGIDGAGEHKSRSAGRRLRSAQPIALPLRAIRDERMPEKTTLYRVGVLEDIPESDHIRKKLIYMMRTRQEEMVVAEVVAAVIWEKRDQPWEFTLDLARHEWDEMRHGLMGQAALEAEGIAWMRYPQFTGDYDLNVSSVPAAQYAWLLGIEQNAMKRTGKRAELEFCRDEAEHPLMSQFQDFDWADEVKHVHIGREWTTHLYDGDVEQARAAAEQAVSEFWTGLEEAAIRETGKLPWSRKQQGVTAG